MMWLPKEGKHFTVESLTEVLKKFPKDKKIMCAVDEEWNAVGDLALNFPDKSSEPITFFPINVEYE